jgi:hypothetical protein
MRATASTMRVMPLLKRLMTAHALSRAAAALSLSAIVSLPLPAMAQAPAVGPDVVSGAELQRWLDSDGMAVAGMFLRNGCYFMAQGTGNRRHQSVKCAGLDAFVVIGEVRVQGDQFCSRFRYPDGVLADMCQEVVRVGDNKYQMRPVGSQPTTLFYRLLP